MLLWSVVGTSNQAPYVAVVVVVVVVVAVEEEAVAEAVVVVVVLHVVDLMDRAQEERVKPT